MEVGASTAVLYIAGSGNPVAGTTTRVDNLYRRRSTGTVPQSGQLNAADMLKRQVRNIHVQYRAGWQVELLMGLDQQTRIMRRRRQIIRLT